MRRRETDEMKRFHAGKKCLVFAVILAVSAAGLGWRAVSASADASALLWVSGDDGVVSVEKKTGRVTALARGTAAVYAIDPETKVPAALTVSVS